MKRLSFNIQYGFGRYDLSRAARVIAGANRLRQLEHCFVTPDFAPKIRRS